MKKSKNLKSFFTVRTLLFTWIILAVILSFETSSFSQEKKSPAPELKKVGIEWMLRMQAKKPEGELKDEDFVKFTTLNLDSAPYVNNLDGLQHCTNLVTLSISGTHVSDISPLARLTKLRKIVLSSNRIEDINTLAGLTEIKELRLDSNLIHDISPLVENPGLGKGTKISLGRNPLSTKSMMGIQTLESRGVSVTYDSSVSLEPILREIINKPSGKLTESDFANLKSLDLQKMRISDIEGINLCTQLKELNLSYNMLTDISPLSGLSKLEVLDLSGNAIQNYDAIASLTNLRELNFIEDFSYEYEYTSEYTGSYNRGLRQHNARIENYELFKPLKKLKKLFLAIQNPDEISGIGTLTNLEELGISRETNYDYDNYLFPAPIKKWDLTPLTNLTNLRSLYLRLVNVNDIGILNQMPNLELLNLDGIGIEGKNTSFECKNLKSLDLKECYFDGIPDFKNMPYLEKLALPSGSSVSDVSFLSDLKNLRELDMSGSYIKDFTPLANLSKLEKLTVKYKELLDLTPIVKLTNLKSLDLSSSKLKDYSALAQLPNLAVLNLSIDKITDVNQLSKLANLEELDLSFNEISDIRPLSHLSKLRILTLTGNLGISSLDGLEGCKNLEELTIGENKLKSLKPLSKLVNLKQLVLCNENNWDWNDSTFSDLSPLSNMSKLEVLLINAKKVSDLKPLSSLTNLKKLRILSEEIKDLKPLSKLNNLEDLRLWCEFLPDITPLKSLTNMKAICLGYYCLDDISALSNYRNVRNISLTYNNIRDISPIVVYNVMGFGSRIDLNVNPLDDKSLTTYIDALKLRGVNVQYDRKKGVDEFIRKEIKKPEGVLTPDDYQKVTTLTMRSSGITYIDDMQLCTNLTELDLSENLIRDIKPISNCTKLTSLNLYDNYVSDLTPLGNMTDLKTLDISGNLLVDLSTLRNLKKLEELTIDEGYVLKGYDLAPVYDMTSLKKLTLSGNEIESIKKIANLTQLKELNLNSNEISDIKYLSSLKNLRKLDLSSNKIEKITSLGELYNLTELNLSNNKISDLGPLSKLGKLTKLTLDNNQVKDLEPLVRNANFGPGGELSIIENPIDEKAWKEQVPVLRKRGVIITRHSAEDECIKLLSELYRKEVIYFYDKEGYKTWEQMVEAEQIEKDKTRENYIPCYTIEVFEPMPQSVKSDDKKQKSPFLIIAVPKPEYKYLRIYAFSGDPVRYEWIGDNESWKKEFNDLHDTKLWRPLETGCVGGT